MVRKDDASSLQQRPGPRDGGMEGWRDGGMHGRGDRRL